MRSSGTRVSLLRFFIMKATLWLLFAAMPIALLGQKLNNIWIIGGSNKPGVTTHGGMIIDFNKVPRTVAFHHREANMFVCNASICDTSGNLLFYTNGCDIFGADDKVLENGESINPGGYHDILCDQINRGYFAGYPGIMILPQPENPFRYYVFHKRVESDDVDPYVNQLLCSVVAFDSDGNGTVIEKNVEILSDSLAVGEMSAVKHTNGADWWVITPRRNSNEFYCFLFTKNGVVDTLLQTIGDLAPAEEEGSGQTTFSHDGSTMARYYSYHDVMMYDFDRATGQFSNYRTIPIDFGNTLAFDGGCAFSPNGRFLYIFALLKVYQFDLWASDIGATQTTVGEWDGFKDPIATVFAWAQLGPDCKIYSQCGDMRYYHIIHNPDEPGLACNFEQRGLVLPTPSGASMPYFPNYRLGPVGNPGVPCSPTVSVGAGPVRAAGAVQVWPNPANEQATFASAVWGEGAKHLVLRNLWGRVVREVEFHGATYTLAVVGLPSGVYLWEVSERGGRKEQGKLIVNY